MQMMLQKWQQNGGAAILRVWLQGTKSSILADESMQNVWTTNIREFDPSSNKLPKASSGHHATVEEIRMSWRQKHRYSLSDKMV
jgi:hypothetical protein